MTTAPSPAAVRRPYWRGTVAILPMAPGAFAFGIAFGALVIPAGINPWAGIFTSAAISAGASQISIVDQLTTGVPVIIAIITALAINLRFALYSAALAPIVGGFPRGLKTVIVALTADPAVPVAMREAPRYAPGPAREHFMLGVFLSLWLWWMTGTIIGVLAGPVIPAGWGVDFIVPLMFASVIVPGIRTSPELTAALTGLVAVVLLRDLPLGLNVVTAGLIGIGAGMLMPGKAGPASLRTADSHAETDAGFDTGSSSGTSVAT